jgi:hypothetical protein
MAELAHGAAGIHREGFVKLADLIVVGGQATTAPNHPGPPPAARVPAGAGVFTAPQSLVAFPLAISIVATIARAGHTIGRTDFDSVGVPLAAAFAVGAGLAAVTVADPRARPRGTRAWVVAIVSAIVNSLVLFAAALGIEKF